MTAHPRALPVIIRPRRFSRRGGVGLALWLGFGLLVQAAELPSEDDFFSSVPVVLTVTRLSQSLADTPGAVTVIDRETIRHSGARDLTDLLRLVPGYMVSGFNGAHPTGAYHAPIDEYGTRNLVLVDGRSLYTSTYLGGTMRALSTVRLEDVERIEVLRGSNSAAYGANALFGVINVVTRHAADAVGGEVSVTRGGEGIQDAYARWGWGDSSGDYRLSVGQRRDDGYRFIYDSRRVDQLAWRGDLRLDADADLVLQLGHTRQVVGDGFATSHNNPERDVTWSNTYALASLDRRLSEHDAVSIALSWDRDRTRDAFKFAAPGPFLGTPVDVGAVEQRWSLEVQRRHVASETLRWVAGLGYREDSAKSAPLFATESSVRLHDTRAFGNVEWRFAPAWVLNAGLFAGYNSQTGAYAAPRLMVNHAWRPNHTLRFGATTAQRPPTLFEFQGKQRFFAPGGATLNGYIADGSLQPEKLRSVELGYLGHSLDGRWQADVRLFRESLRDYLVYDNATLINAAPGFDVRGLEYQLRWTPREGTSVWWSQAWLDFNWRYSVDIARQPPRDSASVALFQRLPGNWDLTLMAYLRDAMSWRRPTDNTLPASTRVDLRIAKGFRLGGASAEVAVTVQALNGDQQEFVVSRPSLFKRRAFLNFRTEF